MRDRVEAKGVREPGEIEYCLTNCYSVLQVMEDREKGLIEPKYLKEDKLYSSRVDRAIKLSYNIRLSGSGGVLKPFLENLADEKHTPRFEKRVLSRGARFYQLISSTFKRTK